MRQPVTLHSRQSLTRHPPYGLYLDPHGTQHHVFPLSPRLLLGVTTVLGSIGAFLLVSPR
ncbi:MAG: hypothetical protein JO023_05280 [Chloroflexi bacterium]|nr:hypothetical protein [Chloroflexota bacterium]